MKDKAAFLFSVNEGSKYPIAYPDKCAIVNHGHACVVFGDACVSDLWISNYSNQNSDSCCRAGGHFNLPRAKWRGANARDSSIDGGKGRFRSKEFEVY